MAIKIHEFTAGEILIALLFASGTPAENIGGFLGSTDKVLSVLSQPEVDDMVHNLRGETVEALSLCWIVQRLKRIAEGPDAAAAVAALTELYAIGTPRVIQSLICP